MEKWSAQLEKFTINFFLDTNILVYLVDDKYPSLTAFIKSLSEAPVVGLYASEYVLSEFIGVRNRRIIFKQFLKKPVRKGQKSMFPSLSDITKLMK